MGNQMEAVRRFTGSGFPFASGPAEPAPSLFYNSGRFPEHHAKEILQTYGLDVPRFMWVENPEQAVRFANRIGYPVVAKVVSPDVYCKSDRGGIETWVADDRELRNACHRFTQVKGFNGVLVEEKLGPGLELNVGAAKVDFRCGPAVFLEKPRTSAEGGGNRTFRMSSPGGWNVSAMLRELGVLPYHRKSKTIDGVNLIELERVLAKVADLVMDSHAGMEAIILDPVRCVDNRCVVLDARIKFSTWKSSNMASMVCRQ